jgi:hypothetical protein
VSKERIGRFRIGRNEIGRGWRNLLPIMGNFVIVRAEMKYSTDAIEYTGFSDLFEEVEEFCEPPLYEILINDLAVPVAINAVRSDAL